MCWLDKKSVETMLKLKDRYKIKTFLETGTFKGVNARFHSSRFEEVLSCDISDEYLKIAKERTAGLENVHIFKESSPDFLRDFVKKYEDSGREDMVFLFLDAHFYDPSLPKEEKWVVLNELRALEGFSNGIICIHDFDNGLGHCTYDGEHLGLPLIRGDLMKVNPNFRLYTNDISSCDIITSPDGIEGLHPDEETLDNIRYAHSAPRLTYRGLLYCVPEDLDLGEFSVRRLESYRTD